VVYRIKGKKNMKGGKIKVLIVENNASTINAIKDLIDFEADMENIGVAHNGLEAVRLSKELSPDIIIMDVKMPKMDGLTATRIIYKQNPKIKIIALTSFANEELKNSMLRSGASSFMDKSTISAENLLEKIKEVHEKGK
jgi:two-component system, NarL family, response regulator NreC